jgi:dTDP-glucose 4,6-dehydratase
MTARVMVTGGAGFIGSTLIRLLVQEAGATVANVDRLTYAASLDTLADVAGHPRYSLVQADVADAAKIRTVFMEFQPDIVMHLAAETHVDRSIDGPADFIKTNILGTFVMLEQALNYWCGLDSRRRDRFRFHHVSTDEVFGALGPGDMANEITRYDPSSPYAATKAASDHLVRAWRRTFNLPVILSNCGNNYGPYQFPEKLIPLMIVKALAGDPLPVYGTGENVRDWLFVEDHARALWTIANRGEVGETYLIGGSAEKTNIDVVRAICRIIDELAPGSGPPRERLISFVADRPGHDLRYAIDPFRIQRELGWSPRETFDSGLRRTIIWYLAHQDWWQPLVNGAYRGERLGKASNSFAPRSALL